MIENLPPDLRAAEERFLQKIPLMAIHAGDEAACANLIDRGIRQGEFHVLNSCEHLSEIQGRWLEITHDAIAELSTVEHDEAEEYLDLAIRYAQLAEHADVPMMSDLYLQQAENAKEAADALSQAGVARTQFHVHRAEAATAAMNAIEDIQHRALKRSRKGRTMTSLVRRGSRWIGLAVGLTVAWFTTAWFDWSGVWKVAGIVLGWLAGVLTDEAIDAITGRTLRRLHLWRLGNLAAAHTAIAIGYGALAPET